jgi:hypothetical protein
MYDIIAYIRGYLVFSGKRHDPSMRIPVVWVQRAFGREEGNSGEANLCNRQESKGEGSTR